MANSGEPQEDTRPRPIPGTDPGGRKFVNVRTEPGQAEPTGATEPGTGMDAPGRSAAPRSILDACEAELATGPEPARRARLHYTMARELEERGSIELAIDHYDQALEANPEHMASIRGGRRARLAIGLIEAALPSFDAEIVLTRDPGARAMLHYARGRLLEDSLGDDAGAREAYRAALELNASSATILKALERIESASDRWSELSDILRREANALRQDDRHRAALLTQRARLMESRGEEKIATELYISALRLDAEHPGPEIALERLFHRQESWTQVVEVYERRAERTSDRALAALLLRRAARLQAEHLESDADAMGALTTAMKLWPKQPLVLDELAPMVQDAERVVSLAEVLRQLIPTTSDPGERASLFHSLGHIYELLGHDSEAIACYANALELDPTHPACIKALDRLYSRKGHWEALIEMYVNEASHTDDPDRGAGAHVRAAAAFEERLHDPVTATEHYGRALARVPQHPIAFKALLRLYRQAKRFRELVELCERGAELATEHNQAVALLFQAAQVWEDALDDPGRAAAVFHRILEREPGNLAAVHGLQRAGERSGRFRDLVSALELELQLGADENRRAELHQRVGTVLADHLDDHDAAIVHFRRVLDIDPTHPPALAALGRLYRARGRWDELLDVYQRELIRARDGRSSAVLLHKMGELCDRCLGRDQDAVIHYERALEHDASFRPALRALAQKLRRRRDWPALADILRREAETAIDSNQRALGWYRLGEVHEYHLGNAHEAARCYEAALATVPTHRPSLAALSRLRHDRADWHTLVDELAIEIDETSDTARKIELTLWRGEIYRDRLSNTSAAAQCFEQVLTDAQARLPALLALEHLYPVLGEYDKLAATYQAIADATTDREGKIAALREMTRTMETHRVGTRAQLLGTYDQLIELLPDDVYTLERIEDVARSTGDPALAEVTYRRLAEVTRDRSLRAHYLCQLAAAMEAQQDFRAIDVYRRAIADSPDQLHAVRGLGRLAEIVGDAVGMADAARLEAEHTSDPRIAADLYVRSAKLRARTDEDGGIEDLRHALALDPEHAPAAATLSATLSLAGRQEDLVDDLSAAARGCKSDTRAADLWLEIAALLQSLGRTAAGIGALQTGLAGKPEHVPSLLKLAELHAAESQWRDSIKAYERVLDCTKDRELYCTVQLELATVWDEKLDDFARAKSCVAAVLDRNGRHTEALTRQARYQSRDGNHDGAAKTLRRLVAESPDDASRASALMRLAEIEALRGDERASEDALKEALVIEGPNGPAANAYRLRAEDTASWVGYAAGLATHIAEALRRSPRPTNAELAQAYLELAQAYDSMQLPGKAIESLQDGLRETDDDAGLLRILTERLRAAGRHVEALQSAHQLTAIAPASPDGWNLVHDLLEDAGQHEEAKYVRHPLRVLEVDDSRPARTRVLSAPISLDVVHGLAPDRVTSSVAANLLASAADAAGKIFPPALESYGLTRRDRITSRSGHPLRDAADRIAEIFTVDEFDFYVHDRRAPLLSLELTEPAAIVVSSAAARLSGSQQAFLLSYAMAALAARFHPAMRLSARELELFLAASARATADSPTAPLSDDGRLNEHAQVIKRAIPRRWRRNFEISGLEYSRSRIHVAQWQQSLLHTAIRSALIVCDDLKSGIKVLRKMHAMPELSGSDLVDSSRTVADLMKFWISEDANRARRACGLMTSIDSGRIHTPIPGS